MRSRWPVLSSASLERAGKREREGARATQRRGEGGWGGGSHSEREDSSVMLDVICSPRTGLPASPWPSQCCRTPVTVLHPLWEAGQLLGLWLGLTGWFGGRAVWSQGSSRGTAGLAEEHHRKQTWASPCWRSERCSARWPWWPTGCLRLCLPWWDSMGLPSPEGGAQSGLSACVWQFLLAFLHLSACMLPLYTWAES